MGSVHYFGEEGGYGGIWSCFQVSLTLSPECHLGKEYLQGFPSLVKDVHLCYH